MRDWPLVPKNHRAVFLDRDGTINVDTHYPHKVEELQFIPGVLEAMTLLATLPLDVIVISNQAGIALNLFTREQMSTFNAALRTQIEQVGGRIDAFYYCPHLEPKNLPLGEALCRCSKPAPGMLEEAAEDFELDLSHCFLVGDKTSDIAAGVAVGCCTALVRTGKGGCEETAVPATPNVIVDDLYAAIQWVKQCIEAEASPK